MVLVMVDYVTAWNRFGLGSRAYDAPPSNPKAWLLRQLDQYDPSPSAIKARQPSAAAVQAYVKLTDIQRKLASQRRQNGMDMSTASPAYETLNQQRRKISQSARRAHMADVAARGLVSVESSAPFMERMVHFWSNHFAISARNRQVTQLAGPYEFDAIRPNMLGSFADLLKASVLHPAMLVYLDQAQSVGPSSPAARWVSERQNRKIGLNENLAREILELHTLGVRSGYSQADVTEFARALTGWTLPGRRRFRNPIAMPNGALFADVFHEPGRRKILRKSITSDGAKQALDALDMLATHPATAKHIATKLARHFAADDPPASMIQRIETAFLDSGGDLPTIYRTIINSPEAWNNASRKFRQPWEWAIASLRATDPRILDERSFFVLNRELGQPVWAPTSPAGYDDVMSSWAGPDALLRRVEAAQRLASRHQIDDSLSLAQALFGNALNDGTAITIRRAASARQGLALLLASPEMMRR